MLKTEAVKQFLSANARPDLAVLYHYGMECQVNVSQGRGERVDVGNIKGKKYQVYTDGMQQWANFRIPKHANTEPEYSDTNISFNLEQHAEGIGMTGWDWEAKRSRWVAFDFDAILGHAESHEKKMADSELQRVQEAACSIPWVTVRKSTSGNGLHLYVFVDDVPTANHVEHAALARAILGKMSAVTGFDFDAKVDNCGHVMWVWHKKFQKNPAEGLRLISQGEVLTEIPISWRDHIRVTSGSRRKNIPGFVNEKKIDWFEELCGQHPRVQLDDQHKALIDWLEKVGALWWFDNDHHMLVAHTYDLQKASDELQMRGIFKTLAKGSDHGGDQNCFAFPMRKGGWVVRRHTPGVAEDPTWDQDSAGWTRTYLNRQPDLRSASKAFNGVEDEKSGFNFMEAEVALQVVTSLGGSVELPAQYLSREARLSPSKDGRMVMRVKKEANDGKFSGWLDVQGKWWQRVLEVRLPREEASDLAMYDDMVRHLVTESDGDAGWVVRSGSEGHWVEEPLPHVKMALKHTGVPPRDIDLVLGSSILNRWMMVNVPFSPEYPGDRQWNRNAAQFSFGPNPDTDALHHPTWDSMFSHCGSGLDTAVAANQWCIDNNIKTGGDYLKLWAACLFQHPTQPLPYLFFFGEQGSGKSIFHESLSLLMQRGVARADTALTNAHGFNGELQGAVMCVVEETDLRSHRNIAYNRMKDWVTGQTISIHIKGATPFLSQNTTHWCQFANSLPMCPVLPGDTRITVCFVKKLAEDASIPKELFLASMAKEGPDLLATLLNLEIPKAVDRLRIPVLRTAYKEVAESQNRDELEVFIAEECHEVPGEVILYGEFYDRFSEWIDSTQRLKWPKRRVGRDLPIQIPKGRYGSHAQWHIGNISWEPKPTTKGRLVLVDDFLREEPKCSLPLATDQVSGKTPPRDSLSLNSESGSPESELGKSNSQEP